MGKDLFEFLGIDEGVYCGNIVRLIKKCSRNEGLEERIQGNECKLSKQKR